MDDPNDYEPSICSEVIDDISDNESTDSQQPDNDNNVYFSNKLKITPEAFRSEIIPPYVPSILKKLEIRLSSYITQYSKIEKREKKKRKVMRELIYNTRADISWYMSQYVATYDINYIRKTVIKGKLFFNIIPERNIRNSLNLTTGLHDMLILYRSDLVNYSKIVFKPLSILFPDEFMFPWIGFDGKITTVEMSESFQFILDHILKIICDGNNTKYEFLLNWLAWIIQHPADKTQIAIILTGDQGTGKDLFLTFYKHILGPHNCCVISNKIDDNFNGHLANKLFVHISEVADSRRSDLEATFETLKVMITDSLITINEKFAPRYSTTNVCNLIITTNHEDWIVIPQKERRYVIMRTSSARVGDVAYFKRLAKCIEIESVQNEFFTFLSTRQLPDVLERIYTNELVECQEASKEPIELFSQSAPTILGLNVNKQLQCTDLYENYYIPFCQMGRFRPPSIKKFGRQLGLQKKYWKRILKNKGTFYQYIGGEN